MYKKIVIPLLIIFSFLMINISYNGSPSYSILHFIFIVFRTNIKKGVSIEFSNYPLEFNLLMIEIIIAIIFLLLSVCLKKKIAKIISAFIILIVWTKNLIVLDFVIDEKKYFLSSIPYLILFLFYLYLIFFKKNTKKEN